MIPQFSPLVFDHTLLRSDATAADFKRLVEEASRLEVAAVCVPPNRLTLVKQLLKKSQVRLCTVIAFPLGYNSTESKLYELQDVLSKGAEEVDFVISLGKFLEGDREYTLNELRRLRESAGRVTLKAIVETALLTESNIEELTLMCHEASMDFIKTSTGFAQRGASLDDVRIMKSVIHRLQSPLKIKASGGVKTKEQALGLMNEGADRIGSSATAQFF